MIIGSNNALAESANNIFQAISKLNSSCTIYANDVSFGVLNFVGNTSSPSVATTINVKCSRSVAYILTPGGSTVSGGSYQFLDGQNGNTDKMTIVLTSKEIPSDYWSTSGDRRILKTGTGNNIAHSINLTAPYNLAVKSNIPIATNTANNTARPGNYAGTLIANITY